MTVRCWGVEVTLSHFNSPFSDYLFRRLLVVDKLNAISIPKDHQVMGEPARYSRARYSIYFDCCDILSDLPERHSRRPVMWALVSQFQTRATFVTTLTLSLVAILGSVNAVMADVPTDAGTRKKVVGNPQQVHIQPSKIFLVGDRSWQQIVVTGTYANGNVRDLTAFSKFRAKTPVVAASSTGIVWPNKNGKTTLTITVAGKDHKIPVTVVKYDQNLDVSFNREVIAAMSVGGCNSGACHGTPSGKNGFKLSLRGYLPAEDYVQLTRDVRGRRTNRNNPSASLIWKKALGRIPHEGGKRFREDSVAAKTIHAWLQQGMPKDPPKSVDVKRIDILPGTRVLKAPARWQQLAVIAHLSDGTTRDVTRLTVFETSDRDVATVSKSGLVEFSRSGEVAVLCRYLQNMQSVRLAYLEPKEGFVWSNPPENNFVDRHVFAKLKMLSIQPSKLCSDEVFIRRAYLDVCAVLPTPEEVQAFLTDESEDKRAKLIDRLLERPEYADFWTMKWLDVLRSTRSKLGDGANAYQKWLRGHIAKNTPFNKVTTELLTADGNTYLNGPANFYKVTRDPTELAEVTAQLFFGIRMQCAKCHNHPFEKWTQDDYYSTAAFFARVQRKSVAKGKKKKKNKSKAEIISVSTRGDVRHLRTGQVMAPKFLGGDIAKVGPKQDRREVFAKWLTQKDNPFFAKSVVNRIWFHLMGRGIVDPVDDFRDSNPSANDALLNALADDFVKHDYDIKHVIRTIMNSRTYQLSATTNKYNKGDEKYFSHAVTKVLTAEQLLDAISAVTEVPSEFKGFPRGTRATQLPDGEVNNNFLKTFNQPARELACECERGTGASLAQALQMLNGKTVHARLRDNKNRISRLLNKKTPPPKMIEELYLATLSRPPREKEMEIATEYIQSAANKREAWEDLQWTLLNTKEFLFRH